MFFSLTEQTKIVEGLTPAADAAGRTGAYVTLKACAMAFVVCHIDQGNAAPVALSIMQAQDVSGANAKAITNAVPIWSDEDCATADALARQTDAVNYATSAATKHKVVVFQIDPMQLDIQNGFDCIAVVTGASDVANITEAMYYLTDLRYAQETPPSAVTN